MLVNMKINKWALIVGCIMIIGIIVLITVLLTDTSKVNVDKMSQQIHVTPQDISTINNEELIKLINSSQPSPYFIENVEPFLKELINRQTFEKYDLESTGSSIISKFIDEIVFINLQESEDRKVMILNEIAKIAEPDIQIFRIDAIKKKEGALGCALTHLNVILKSLLEQKNILCLEDDFCFNDDKDEIILKLTTIDEVFPQERWDIIVFGQYCKSWSKINNLSKTQLMRILESTTTSGYLINKQYAETLYREFSNHLSNLLTKEVFDSQDHIDQFQLKLQLQHIWIGFPKSIGKQRPIKSIIGNVMSDNGWKCSEDLTKWFAGSSNIEHSLILQPDFKLLKIAVCLVATGRYIQFVENIQRDLISKFCRPHHIHLFLFSDSHIKLNNISNYFTKRTGFPGDTLHRYDYILKAENELKEYDFIFYVDVDYRILEYVLFEHIFPDISKPVIAVTTHLFGLEKQWEGKNLIGTPDINPKSQACIYPHEKMISYFAGGFQGGRTDAFLEMCKELSKRIAIDEMNQVLALWHDESHLNRYCVDRKPDSILSQSFIYPEHCLNPENMNSSCIDLRIHKIKPIMIPLDKDHEKVRGI